MKTDKHNKHKNSIIMRQVYLLFLKTTLKIRQAMQKMTPATPTLYMNATTATSNKTITELADPSEGIPSENTIKMDK